MAGSGARPLPLIDARIHADIRSDAAQQGAGVAEIANFQFRNESRNCDGASPRRRPS
jgi:hypothetical protein